MKYLNNFIKFAAVSICAAGVFACSDMKELEDRVDDLSSRVEALETQIGTLNSTIDAIHKLLDTEALFITNITTNANNNTYTLTMSDGKSYTIVEGKIGNTPVVAVDDEGYWEVNYGSGFERLKVQGSEVEVSSRPQFRVSNDGYWQVSTDGSWENVLDEAGKPVSASSSSEGTEFFQNIDFDEETGELSLTLANGESYTFTVSSDFICQILDSEGAIVSEKVVFNSAGQTKTFSVKLKGVAETYIQAPEGWTVSLDAPDASGTEEVTGTLTVKAPGTASANMMSTKVSADTESDIIIQAISAKGQPLFTKMSVELTIQAMPDATIAVGGVTESSVSFTVTPNEDVTSWKYLLYASSVAAPTTAEAFANATTGSANNLTLSQDANGTNLVAKTEYTLYVLVVNDTDNVSKIVSASATPDYSTYAEAYDAGETITIGGLAINKTTYGNAQKVSGGSLTINVDSNTFVYFLESATEVTLDGSASSGQNSIILIGNTPGKKVSANINKRIFVPNTNDANKTYIFHNLDFNCTSNSAVIGLPASDVNIIFSECKIAWATKQNLLYSSSERTIKNMVFDKCRIDISDREDTQNRPLLAFSSSTTTIENFVFTNNVIYSTTLRDFRMMALGSGTVTNCIIKNNTFSNAWQTFTGGNTRYFQIGTVGTLECTKNVIYSDKTYESSYTATSYGFFSITNITTGGYCNDNIIYKPNMTDKDFTTLNGNCNKADGFTVENIKVIEENPFSNANNTDGIFVTNSTYADYGAQQ